MLGISDSAMSKTVCETRQKSQQKGVVFLRNQKHALLAIAGTHFHSCLFLPTPVTESTVKKINKANIAFPFKQLCRRLVSKCNTKTNDFSRRQCLRCSIALLNVYFRTVLFLLCSNVVSVSKTMAATYYSMFVNELLAASC